MRKMDIEHSTDYYLGCNKFTVQVTVGDDPETFGEILDGKVLKGPPIVNRFIVNSFGGI